MPALPLSLATALACLALASPPAAAGEDLGQLYPGKMTWSESGLFPVCSADDVFELKSFDLSAGKDLKLSCHKAVVAFGVYQENVLWAVVFPDKPARIESTRPGDGESASTLFLRFAPADVDVLFPAATVAKRGSAWQRAEASRIAQHKIGWKWSTPAGNPTIVPAGGTIVDADTVQGGRRFYFVDRNAGSVEYVAEFEGKPVPSSPPLDEKTALAAFDEVWKAFDLEYACFALSPSVDWKDLGKTYRKQAAGARTVHGAAAVISDMLAQLENLHVWVKAGEDWLPGYAPERPLNGSWKATEKLVSAAGKEGGQLRSGRTQDGIGYLGVHGLGQADLPAQVDAALEGLGDTYALIVDLRFNGGGDELLARDIAGRFLDEERVYSKNRYRAGPGHDQLGDVLERRAGPRGPWRYAAPVVVLFGQRTMSSAESMALMLAQCPNVTTLGDRTAGSSGNPRRLELACGITVNLPRWLDMDPEGHTIEHTGVAPEVPIQSSPADFTDDRDPVMAAALERLRAIPPGERAPGRR